MSIRLREISKHRASCPFYIRRERSSIGPHECACADSFRLLDVHVVVHNYATPPWCDATEEGVQVGWSLEHWGLCWLLSSHYKKKTYIHILNFTISPFLNHNVSTGDQSVVKKQLVQWNWRTKPLPDLCVELTHCRVCSTQLYQPHWWVPQRFSSL